MEAKEFLKNIKRMCKECECKGCAIWDEDNGACRLVNLPRDFDDKIVDIVEEWSKNNPPETRGQAAKRLFGDAVYLKGCDTFDCSNNKKCSECEYLDFWDKPFEVDE